MFKRDLIDKYGEGRGVREKELRKALRFRALVFGGIGLVVVLLMGGLYLIEPVAPLVLLAIVGGVGALFGAFELLMWIAENWETEMGKIKAAKKHGVLEEK